MKKNFVEAHMNGCVGQVKFYFDVTLVSSFHESDDYRNKGTFVTFTNGVTYRITESVDWLLDQLSKVD